MERIKTPSRFQDKFGPGKDGFRDGNPAGGQASTQLEAAWFDNAQEEIANAIELSGLTLDPNDMTQLFQAIGRIAGGPYVLRGGDTMTGALAVPTLGVTGNAVVDGTFSARLNRFVVTNKGNVMLVFAEPADMVASGGRMLVHNVTSSAYSFNLYENEAGIPHILAGGGVRVGQIALDPTLGWTVLMGPAGTPGQPAITAPFLNLYPDIALGLAIAGEDATWVSTSGPWSGPSDARLKKNVADYTAGLSEVCALRPVSFEYNGEGGTIDSGKVHIGIIAQEAQAVMPELIRDMTEPFDTSAPLPRNMLPGQLGSNVGPLTFALVNAVKEIAERLDALEATGRTSR